MNKPIRYVLLSAAIAVTSRAAPFMAVGDGAELFATGSIEARADDNILFGAGTATSPEMSDVIFDITPGLELDFGKNSQTKGSLILSDTFSNYTDHSRFNANLFNADAVSRFDDGKMKLGINAGYHELSQNSPDVQGAAIGRLIRRDIMTAGASTEVEISEITAVGAGADFRHENYHPANYVDSDTFTIPVNFYYKWTPKIDLSAGFQYRDYEAKSNSAPDSTDSFYSIGARGEFTPKLTGRFAVGYTQRRFSNSLPSETLVGIDSTFAYEYTPKTTIQFGLTNDFGTSPAGAQQKNLTANLGGATRLTEQWSLNGGISYRSIRYYGGSTPSANRTDDYWEATLGAAYNYNANLRFVGAYIFRTYQTDLAGSGFDNNVFSLAANFRY